MNEDFIIKTIQKIAGKSFKATCEIGKAVNVTDDSFTLIRDGKPELLDVRINAVVDDLDTYIKIIPADDSHVIVSRIEGTEEAFLSSTSKIKKIVIKTANQKFEISDDEIIINDGTNDGLAKVAKVTDKLNNIESEINNLKLIFSAWIPAFGDGGTLLKTAVTTWASQPIVQTVQNEIENNKVKH